MPSKRQSSTRSSALTWTSDKIRSSISFTNMRRLPAMLKLNAASERRASSTRSVVRIQPLPSCSHPASSAFAGASPPDGSLSGDSAVGTSDGGTSGHHQSESFTQPPSIHATSIRDGRTTLFHASKIDADLSRFRAEQHFFFSKDGTRVPLFLVYDGSVRREGPSRLLLHGYGGYNWAQRPSFDAFLIAWLERGGTYALANIRGGSEYGEAWHQAGRRHNKQNVFDDFVAAAEFLIRERRTSPNLLAIRGISNGGLLVAAAITQRPDLFRAALCEVPLTDMIRFQLVGEGSPQELGSPDDRDDFRALYAYSPYHHVVQGTKYPATLITAGEHDDRAHPIHARKFAAALQAASTGGEALLRVEWNTGHNGSDVKHLEIERVTSRGRAPRERRHASLRPKPTVGKTILPGRSRGGTKRRAVQLCARWASFAPRKRRAKLALRRTRSIPCSRLCAMPPSMSFPKRRKSDGWYRKRGTVSRAANAPTRKRKWKRWSKHGSAASSLRT